MATQLNCLDMDEVCEIDMGVFRSDAPVRDSQLVPKRPWKKDKQSTGESSAAANKQKVVWNKESEQYFLDLYEDSYFNHCNQGNVSGDQWKVLASTMNEKISSIVPFDPQVLRNKLDSFIKRYRIEKQKQSQTGAAPSEWEYFTQMHRIRGPSPKEKGIPLIRGPSPKEKGIPFPLDGGHDLNAVSANPTEFPICDESHEVIAESGVNTDPFPASGLSFSEMLLNEDEHGGMDPSEAAFQSPGGRQFPTNEADIPIERTTTPPRSSPQRVHLEPGGSQSVTSPRTKACSQPDIQGKPNKRRKSTESDEMAKTMKDFVGIYKESFEDRKTLEREKMELMREMLQLRRMEMETQRQAQSSHHTQ